MRDRRKGRPQGLAQGSAIALDSFALVVGLKVLRGPFRSGRGVSSKLFCLFKMLLPVECSP